MFVFLWETTFVKNRTKYRTQLKPTSLKFYGETTRTKNEERSILIYYYYNPYSRIRSSRWKKQKIIIRVPSVKKQSMFRQKFSIFFQENLNEAGYLKFFQLFSDPDGADVLKLQHLVSTSLPILQDLFISIWIYFQWNGLVEEGIWNSLWIKQL